MNREASIMVLSDNYLAMIFSFFIIFKQTFKIVVDSQKITQVVQSSHIILTQFPLPLTSHISVVRLSLLMNQCLYIIIS